MSLAADSFFSSSPSSTVTATDAKKDFGKILEKAIKGEIVTITKHDAPKAVLISVDQLNALSPQRKIDSLDAQFDAMYDQMQTAETRMAMKKAFSATPEKMGQAALRGARRNRRD
jgi:antitoxin Phd